MEKVLSPDEKLKRAEQIYYRRRGMKVNENKTVNVPVSNQNYLLKKMIIQIIICLIIYCTYFVIKNYNFIFSKEVIDKTNQMLSYDINIQEIYCKVANYINNYEYFNNREEQIPNEENKNPEEESDNEDEIVENNDEYEVQETKVDTISNTDINVERTALLKNNTNQMQLDADIIKQKYSLINPLQGQITSRFGVREAKQDIVSAYHVGLDIAANTGTEFVASMEGTVVYAGELSGYGNCIQTKKDDILVIYGHCSKLYVNKGEVVTQGQPLGEVGATGKATGPHLHFEIRKSDRYVDPEMII